MVIEAGLALQPQQQVSPIRQVASHRKTRFPNSQQATSEDIATLMRQTGQTNPSMAAIGVPRKSMCQCRHGYPQAFAMDPLYANRMNSGLLKLTCPILVRAIDELEDSGIMDILNDELQQEQRQQLTSISSNSKSSIRYSTGSRRNGSSRTLLEEMELRHAVHAQVRQNLLSREEKGEMIPSKLGKRGSQAFLESGVAGATPLGSSPPNANDNTTKQVDVKCLHAWMADALFVMDHNSNNNVKKIDHTNNDRVSVGSLMGDRISYELAAASLLVPSPPSREQDNGAIKNSSHRTITRADISGTPDCHVLCNPAASQGLANPPKPRNKQRLRTGKESSRKKRRKYQQQQEQSDSHDSFGMN